MRSLLVSVAALVLIVLNLPAAHAQTEILYFPVNARAVGMGYTGTADNTDPSSIYFNPANVVAQARAYLVGSNDRFESDDLSLFRVDAGGSWKSNPESTWRFGANAAFSRLESSIFDIVDVDEQMISLALGAGTTRDRYEFRFGAAVKRLSTDETIHYLMNPTHETIDGYAWDGGIAVAIHGNEAEWNVTPQFGVALIDAGPDLEGDFTTSLPTRVNIGTSIRVASPLTKVGSAEVPVFAAIVNLEGESPDEGAAFWAMGTEISLAQILFLRGGLIIPSGADDIAETWGAGLGVPIEQFRIRFDYSDYVDEDYIRDEMSLLVAWLF